MLILLPPSETKAPGGSGPPLDLAALSWPELTGVRARLLHELAVLAKDPAAARTALGLSIRQDDQADLNARLDTARTTPALRRYTGVLYDAFDAASLTRAGRARAAARIAIGSALFGLVRATDPIPAYRFSAGSVLPDTGRPGTLWRPVLEPLLATIGSGELVVDLRSGAYAELARCPGAVTVRVLTEQPDGRRIVVSHHNKATKGRLARVLTTTRRELTDVNGVAALARTAGLIAEPVSDTALDVLTPGGIRA